MRWTYRQTEMTKLIFAFRNFANASKSLGRSEVLVTMLMIAQAFCDFTPGGQHLPSFRRSCMPPQPELTQSNPSDSLCLEVGSSKLRISVKCLQLNTESHPRRLSFPYTSSFIKFPLNVYSSVPSHIQEDLAFRTPSLLLNFR